jgi:hypothetical protein
MAGRRPLERVVFRCTEDSYGTPEPFLSDRSPIIHWQNGRAEVSRYEAARPPGRPSPSRRPCVNWEDLEEIAKVAIRCVFGSETAEGVYTCPPELWPFAEWV